jgi:hypothetical protein
MRRLDFSTAMMRLGLAGGAVATKDDLVAVCVKPQTTREPVDGALEITVIEGHQAPAGIAQQVVMVGAGGVDQLIAGHATTEVQARNEPSLLEKLQDAIDARASHTTFTGAKAIFDLKRAQRTRLTCEEVDHRVACSAFAVSGLIENSTGVLSPLRSSDCQHCPRF